MMPMSPFKNSNSEDQESDGESTTTTRPLSILERDGLSLEAILARGSFSMIYRVHLFVDGKDQRRNGAVGDASDSEAYYYCIQDESSYAMKCLSPPSKMKTTTEASLLTAAAKNLFYEASILSRLDHPNVIKIRGVSTSCFTRRQISLSDCENNFILLELLQGTLRNRLDLWRLHQSRFFKGLEPPSNAPGGNQERSLSHWSGRLKIASEIANGMKYLHSQGIVFRNLAPENVGFDLKDGTVKLFDFGVTRSLKESFVESAAVGCFRYMAPENILCQPSGYPSDVYSFGVLLWEIATLQLPFEAFFSIDKATKQQYFAQTKFTSQVILKSWRPETGDNIDCPSTKELIQKCWAGKPESRPTFDTVADIVSKTHCQHLERNETEQAPASSDRALPGRGLLRARSLSTIQRSGSFDGRISMKRSSSGGRVSSTLKLTQKLLRTPTRTSRPTITSSNSYHSNSDLMNTVDGDNHETKVPIIQQPNQPILGRHNLQRVPSKGRINLWLSTLSHITTPTASSVDNSEFSTSDHDESESSQSNVQPLSPSGCRREDQDVRQLLSAASKTLTSLSPTSTTQRPSRSVTMPTINSLSSEQSSSSLIIDDNKPGPVVEPQQKQLRDSFLRRRWIRSLSTSSRSEATERSTEEADTQEASNGACADTIDGEGKTKRICQGDMKPRRTKSLIGERESNNTGSVTLLRNLSGLLVRKNRQSSWSTRSTSPTLPHVSITSTNAVWEQRPENSAMELAPGQRKTSVRRHLKGARAELSASNHCDA